MRRLPQLDLLRGFAVLLVIAYHCSPLSPVSMSGWIGVDLFFVLSGFLISGLLFEELLATRTLSIGRFLVRRGFKIYPAYYAMLLFVLLMRGHWDWWGMRYEFTFLQNYRGYVLPHTWSLAIEEHFYILLPIVLLLLYKSGRINLIPWIMVALAVLCLSLRVYAASTSVIYNDAAFPTHLRIDALWAGVTVRYFYQFKREVLRIPNRWSLTVGALLISPSLFWPRTSEAMIGAGLTSMYVGFALILVASLNSDKLRMNFAETVGQHSYSIYLWHPIVFAFAEPLGTSPFGFFLKIALCVSVGIAMAHMIEIPTLSLRDRTFKTSNSRFRSPQQTGRLELLRD